MTDTGRNLLDGIKALACAVLTFLPSIWGRYLLGWIPVGVGVAIDVVFIVGGITAWLVLTLQAFRKWNIAAGFIAVLGAPLIAWSAIFLMMLGIGTYFYFMKMS